MPAWASQEGAISKTSEFPHFPGGVTSLVNRPNAEQMIDHPLARTDFDAFIAIGGHDRAVGRSF